MSPVCPSSSSYDAIDCTSESENRETPEVALVPDSFDGFLCRIGAVSWGKSSSG